MELLNRPNSPSYDHAMTCVRMRLATALALLSAACSGAAGSGANRSDDASKGTEHDLVGTAAPNFDLKAQYGASRVSLEDSGGKVRVVDFWATWCEPCKESFPAYQRLADEHGEQLVIIGLSVDDEPNGIRAFAEETRVKFPLAWDEGQAVSARYNPPTMPTSYVISKDGIVRHVHAGFRSGDEQQIENMIATLLE
jgi:cytochrome c biogenesis protein CcmG, thiol:disulfide interchange protein DsbE